MKMERKGEERKKRAMQLWVITGLKHSRRDKLEAKHVEEGK